MKKLIFSLILLIIGVAVFNRCSNEIDLYADYKDITIVYGILDVSDDTAWIKITKAFTGPGNALTMAHNSDSSNYPYKLGVSLNGKINNNDLPAVNFDTITIYNKQQGDSVFYYPKQLMYYSTDDLDIDASYTLNINTKNTEITSQTALIGGFTITYPYNTIDFKNDHDIKWNSAKNGKRYEVTTIFNYKEYLPGIYEDTLNLKLKLETITNPVKVSKNADGGESLKIRYTGDKFFSELDSKLDKTPNIERWTGLVDVIISSGSEVLHYYIEINDAAAGSLLQEVPQYSNINNGIGIFASRHNVVKSAPLSTRTEDKLVLDYEDLGFIKKSK